MLVLQGSAGDIHWRGSVGSPQVMHSEAFSSEHMLQAPASLQQHYQYQQPRQQQQQLGQPGHFLPGQQQQQQLLHRQQQQQLAHSRSGGTSSAQRGDQMSPGAKAAAIAMGTPPFAMRLQSPEDLLAHAHMVSADNIRLDRLF